MRKKKILITLQLAAVCVVDGQCHQFTNIVKEFEILLDQETSDFNIVSINWENR